MNTRGIIEVLIVTMIMIFGLAALVSLGMVN